MQMEHATRNKALAKREVQCIEKPNSSISQFYMEHFSDMLKHGRKALNVCVGSFSRKDRRRIDISEGHISTGDAPAAYTAAA